MPSLSEHAAPQLVSGLRPVRTAGMRVERDPGSASDGPVIVHNYGGVVGKTRGASPILFMFTVNVSFAFFFKRPWWGGPDMLSRQRRRGCPASA